MRQIFYFLLAFSTFGHVLNLEVVALAEESSPEESPSAQTPSTQTPSADGSGYEEYYENLKEKYEELLEESGKRSSDAYKWMQQDFKNMFSWEYKVVTFSLRDQVKLNDELEKLGVERWELIQVIPQGGKNDGQFFFKRRPKSYLKSIPLKDLMRLIPTGGGAAE